MAAQMEINSVINKGQIIEGFDEILINLSNG